MNLIDIDKIIHQKAAKYEKFIPKFVINWLKKTIHQQDVNDILTEFADYPPQQFCQACFKRWGVTYSIEGLENLDPNERYLFAANHPFGGMDGMMLADKIIDHFGSARVVVNDLLMHLEPLRELWIPVNKHGRQSPEYAEKFDREFSGEHPIVTFPAGLCSRRPNDKVEDLPWKTSFVKKAHSYNRTIVPIFVEGELSDFFYRVSNIRAKMKVGFNVEMLWLVDEMFSQGGRHFRMFVGRPIARQELAAVGNYNEQVAYVRAKCYELQK